jgi:dTDP-4-dehydrorhamnose reductase
MKVLLAGAAGQLGREMQPLLSGMGAVTAVDRVFPPDGAQGRALDLADFEAVEALLEDLRPDVIVNAAAYTAVDAAEDEPGAAYRINADFPGLLANHASSSGAFLLHYSTDYVFSGEAQKPYREGDRPGPLGVYGASKLAGEEAIAASGCRNLVVRTSWVWSGQGNNFVLTMLRLAASRSSLSVVDDQVGRPTWARNLAAASHSMLQQALQAAAAGRLDGICHYCDREAVSWCEFARAIFDSAAEIGLLGEAPAVKAVGSEDYPQKARRPAYSVLDTSRAERCFGIEPAGLHESLRTCLREIEHARR